MSKVIKSWAAEVAPPIPSGEVWYLPIFGIYHPKKPERCFRFFSNMQGFILEWNPLVWTEFNKQSSSRITQILQGRLCNYSRHWANVYSFKVGENHRDYLRFFWYRNLTELLIEYRMCVHVFCNSPSPAVASYGLRKNEENAKTNVNDFVNKKFYVDDGLVSLPESNDAINLMKRTQSWLKTANLRLHKIASNSKEVMRIFLEEDLQSGLKSLNLDEEQLPTNQSLGLLWDLHSDCFRFNIELEPKPYTRRGLLSTLNSVFDALGFAAPVIICGKILLREITTGCDCDEPLNPVLELKWKTWRESLLSLREFTVQCMYIQYNLH